MIQHYQAIPSQFQIQSQPSMLGANPSIQNSNLGQQIPLQNTYIQPIQTQQKISQSAPTNTSMNNFGAPIPPTIINQQILQGPSNIPYTAFNLNSNNQTGKFQPLPTIPLQMPQVIPPMPYTVQPNVGIQGPIDLSKINGKVVQGDPVSYIETGQGKFVREAGMSDKEYFTKALGIKGTIIQIGDPKVI